MAWQKIFLCYFLKETKKHIYTLSIDMLFMFEMIYSPMYKVCMINKTYKIAKSMIKIFIYRIYFLKSETYKVL